MEMATGTSQGQDTPVSEPAQQASESTHQAAERTFRQQEVNDIVQRAKRDAVESYQRRQATEQQPAVRQDQQYSVPGDDQVRRIAEDAARQHVENARQEAMQQAQYEASQRTVNNFWSKVNAGKGQYQDFDAVAGDIQLGAFPNVVQLLGDYVDNSADVLYHLGNDRFRLSELETMAIRSPQDAIKAAQRLSQGIRDNRAAEKTRLPNEPLSQVRPSNTGTDSGVLSVSDYRKKYKV